MTWLQDNLVIVVVGIVVAVVLLWWLFGRSKPEAIETQATTPAEPRKPIAPAKPEIVAAEPARFKSVEPAPPPPPAPEPVIRAEPEPAAPPPPIPEEPTVPAATAAETPLPTSPRPVPVPNAEPPEPSATLPEEPTVPAPEPAPAPAITSAPADNLQLIKGVGPKLVVLLNGLGVTSFQQIADWSDSDIAAIDPQLGAFQGRIARDNLVDQAGYLARGDKAGFEAKYGALGGEL